MPQKDIYINICARIFFNTIFLAFTVFGLYLSFCDAYSYPGDYNTIFIINIVFSFIMCVLWTGNNIWCNTGLFIFNLWIAVIVVRKCRLIESEFEILYKYIKRQYYIYEKIGETSVDDIRGSITVAGLQINEKLAMVLLIILIIMIASMALFRLKWSFLLLFPVVLIIGMEMMHGKAPSVKAASFFVYGISGLLFSSSLDVCGGKRHFWQKKPETGQMWIRYIVFTVIMAVCITVASGAGRNTKGKVFVHSKKFLKKQHEMEKEAADFVEKLVKPLGKEDSGYLDNSPPDQTGQAIFRIETNKKPSNNIYIKAFSADIYENGRWKPFGDVTPPVSETNIGEQAYGSLEACINAKSDWTDDIDNFNMNITEEWSFRKKELFTPYIYSTKGTDGYQYNCYNMQNWRVSSMLSTDSTLREYYGIEDIKEYTLFVYKNYLKVPKELKKLRKYASNIVSGNNAGAMCMYIKDIICYNTKYSQKLKPVPQGQDYIEYFLFKQKKGYCEHYATAGTLLLRLKGIPARYVSGYFIRPYEFRLEHDKSGNEKYVSYVEDYNAHAWTEVYKEGFGWIPFDMTNPVMEEEDNININENVVSVPSSVPQDIDDNSETEPDNNEEEVTEEEEEQEVTEDVTSIKEESGKLDESKLAGNNKETIYLKKEIFLILSVLLILLIPFIYIRIRFMLLLRKAGIVETPGSRVIIYFAIFNNYLAFCGLRDILKLDDASYAEKIAGIMEGKESGIAYDVLQCAVFSNKNINSDEEEAVARFIKKASGRAYKNCSKPARFIIYILTGRKEINIFTKAGN